MIFLNECGSQPTIIYAILFTRKFIMLKYTQNELFSITDFTKQIGSIKERTLEKK